MTDVEKVTNEEFKKIKEKFLLKLSPGWYLIACREDGEKEKVFEAKNFGHATWKQKINVYVGKGTHDSLRDIFIDLGVEYKADLFEKK